MASRLNMYSKITLQKKLPLFFNSFVRNIGFKSSDLEIEITKSPKEKPDPEKLLFGQQFSDHMLEIDWDRKNGWEKPKIVPVRNFSLHPGAKVFHYAIELFEGMKAYRGEDNVIRMFRPDKNMERMKNTAIRSSLPDFDASELMECIKRLINIDREWVPYSNTSSLYIRPTMIGTDPSLGVAPSSTAKLFVLTGPVGPYYPTGFKPISLLADPKYVRSWEGGSGNYKMGCNYAATILIQEKAMKEHKCQQVLWLYGKDEQITEVGTMNLFVILINEDGKRELITPPLNQGIILPGVTRLSLLELTRKWGEFKVSERIVTMGEVIKASKEKRLLEIFGSGTAAVVSPVNKILYKNNWLDIATMEQKNPIYKRLNDELTSIHYGRVKNSEWMIEVPVYDEEKNVLRQSH